MEKALISGYDLSTRAATTEQVKVQFNPETYSVTHSNSFDVTADGAGKSAPLTLSFLERKPAVLSLELVFDTYRHGVAAALQSSVRSSFSALYKFTKVKPSEHTPPPVKFSWGTFGFVGVITSFEETYTMFLDDGKPVRAKVKLSISGGSEDDLTAQANESPDRTKRRTISQGETLWSIAAREYGSPESWRVIARANGIENPRRIQAADELTLPALPDGGEEQYGRLHL